MGAIKLVLTVVGILAILGAVIAPLVRLFIAARQGTSEETSKDIFATQGKRILIVIGAGLALLFISSAFVQIEAGHVGVAKTFGAVTGTKFQPGLHLKFPLVQTVEPFRTQRLLYETSDSPGESSADYKDFSVDTMTEDGQRIKVRFTVAFSIDGKKADWVAQNIGTEANVVEKVVKANARSECRNVPKSFKASDLYGENVYDAQAAIFAKLQPVFEKNGVILQEFLLRDIGFDENLAQALERKQIALEDQVTAQRQVEVKAAEASQTIAAARGTSRSDVEKARGQAEAIRIINDTLENSPSYTQYILAKGVAEGTSDIQWVVTSDGMRPILNLSETKAAVTPKP